MKIVNYFILYNNMNNGNKGNENKDIYNYINLSKIRSLLINEPKLYILFEILCTHINEYINNK